MWSKNDADSRMIRRARSPRAAARSRLGARTGSRLGARSHARSWWRPIVVALLLLEIAVALGAPLVAPHDPYRAYPEKRFHPPGSSFPLGTDHLGRDVLSRIIFGGREMLFTLAIALAIAGMAGGGAGVVTAMLPATADGAVTLLLGIALAFPVILLATALIGVFGASLGSLGLILGVVFAPVVAHQARGLAHAVLARPYVDAVRSVGGGTWYIMARHVIPAIQTQMLHFMAIIAILMISIGSALSFLGLARRPPVADWGLMLRDARSYLLHAPWLALSPGIAIALTGVLLYGVAETGRKWQKITILPRIT